MCIRDRDMHYVGKACYGRLEENLRGKIELGQGFMDSGYTRLTVSVLERTNGLVDQIDVYKRQAMYRRRSGACFLTVCSTWW